MQSLPPTIDERRAQRARRRVVPAAITVAATVGGVMGLVPSASAAPASAVRPAPVIGAAAQGGNVIVWLKDQHSNLNLRTQGALRTKKAHQDQKPLVADIKASGGTHILRLVSVNSVAATVSAAEVAHLRTLPYVAKIVPDGTVTVGDPKTVGPLDKGATVVPDPTDLSAKQTHADGSPDADATNPFPTQNDCGTQDNPLVEPEALGDIDAPAMTNAGLSTEPGHGVVVANDGLSESPNFDLVGNPNFVRPAADGGGSIVESATPGDTVDKTDGEYYGDASSIAAQGTVEYSYGTELPYSGMPTDCYFTLVGDAPGVTLVDTDNINTPESAAGDTNPETLSDAQIVAGIDAAVIKYHTDVINESYGYTNTPGSYATHYAANDAAVASGVTVVVSSGDSGVTGTVSSPATDPLVIAAGATNTLRLNAMAYGFTGWDNDDITPLSSGGTSPNNKVVDLVAPGYGGEAACNPDGSDCPTNTSTEAFGGTSEAAPLIAGAAADVIQAYRDSHNNESPSPALVKQLLVGTAKDIDAPADEQGAGLVDIKAAMAAAAQTTDTTATTVATSGLIPDRTQLDLSGEGGTTTYPTVNVYNPSNATTTVTGTYRQMGPEQQIGDTVTENVSAPDASLPVPADGADAATPVTFDVPSGLDRLDADMIWPDATNGNVLNFVLIDPDGKLAQISYDYGAAKTGGIGSVPDTQHVEVAHPEAGTWTAEIKWGNGRSHLQEEPNVPGTYTGTVSFKASGQNWVTSPGPTVSIGSHRSAAVPVSVTFPDAPGDHPESLQLTSSTSGSTLSLPIARRTLIPSSGGEFDPVFTSSVGRGLGGIETFDITVPAGDPDLGVAMQTADASADNPMSFYLVNPSGTAVTHTVNGRATSAYTFAADAGGQGATAHVANPAAGTWEIDVKLNLTTSGQEFVQPVTADVLPQAPVITSPGDGTDATSQTPTISGTGAAGDTVTVVDGSGDTVCTDVVADNGTWSCAPATALAAGPVTLSATQADQTANPSLVSNSVTVTIPSTTSVALSLDPQAPAPDEDVVLTATTTGVPDGTEVTFLDGSTSLGTADVTSGTATLDVTDGFGVGSHELTASVAATDTTLASVSPEVDVTISKTDSTIMLALSATSAPYGTAVTGSITVSGASGGTATVTWGKATRTVDIGSDGTGTFTVPGTLAPGSYTVTASYDGTGTVAASGDATASLTIAKATTTTNLTVAKKNVAKGGTDSVTVTLKSEVAGVHPVGYVSVTSAVDGYRRTKLVRVTKADAGSRTVTITVPNHAGAGTVSAVYRGNADYVKSTSPVRNVTVG